MFYSSYKYIIIFSILFCTCFCLDFNWESDAIRKYTRLKILSDCLGHGFVQSWKESLKSSTEKCFSEESFGEGPNLVSLLEEILLRRNTEFRRKETNPPLQYPNIDLSALASGSAQHPLHSSSPQSPFLIYLLPFAAPQNLAHHPSLSVQQPLHYLSRHAHPNLPHPTQRIWKRSTAAAEAANDQVEVKDVENEDREGKKINLRAEWRAADMEFETNQLLKTIPQVTTIRRQLGNRISNITCVLKSMELLDENGSPNYSYNINLINRLNVPESLRASLREAQDFCKEFSMCVPIHRMSDIVVREVGYSIVFMKCMKKMILQACVAHDMKTSKEDYGLEIPELFSNSAPLKDRSAYASRKLFEESPAGVAKNLEGILEAEDEVAFGF